ncbi:UDP-glucose 4-epimerase [Xanthobacter versatilis]|uniref:UDP-glucose 4-epimerase n=1 Tax=Xanthobacter autotrophicus (strain ATCC BAA-1158 / Py2) TaxID=78245 RepID=A7IPF3_XANP2|nr:UDP-glucose 4-epimerase [Xanthobacter autotrophicus Py2]
MSVLVTGGAGYIGSHAVLELVGRGESVTVLDDLSTGFDWAVPEAIDLVVGDVGDAVFMRRLLEERGITEIIHFAARSLVAESVADPLGYYFGNIVKTRTLIQTAIEAGVTRMIFSSSASVYGEPVVDIIGEDEPTVPINPYGRSKLASEWMLEDAARAHGLVYTALRYFNVAGADPLGRSGQSSRVATHLIKIASQVAAGARPGLEIYGTDYPTRDGTCIRDYIHVTDLARAHVAALERLRAGGGSLKVNCGYGRGYSVKEVVDVVKEVSGIDFPVTLSPRRPGDPACLVARADRVRAELGWEPTLDHLPTIVGHAIEWEKRLERRKAAQRAAASSVA